MINDKYRMTKHDEFLPFGHVEFICHLYFGICHLFGDFH